MSSQSMWPPAPALGPSWKQQSWPLRILRAFLGVTFVYAGVQKFLDPSFLHPGTAGYVGTQLQGFAQGSPIRQLILLLGHVPTLTGVAVALTETAVGLGTLMGIAPMSWAAVGLLVNLILFLSATWHVTPYFLGSDSMYAVAWAAYLTGLVELRRASIRAAHAPGARRRRSSTTEEMPRRTFLRGAAVAAGAALLGMASTALASPAPVAPDANSTPGRHRRTTASPGRGTSAPRTSPSPPQGTPIASLDDVPIGGALPFSDAGQPAVLCRFAKDRVAAFSRVCTHAGCLVDYDPGTKLLICPCHGAAFDPANGAEPVAGPTPIPLPSIRVAIDHATGQVLAQS
jgi:thiosulfate dehydrogenase [quinone] large subunit